MAPFKKSLDYSPSGTSSPAFSQADDFSYSDAPRPFKDINYRKNVGRRNKTLKQIIAGERERVDKIAKEKREREEEQKDKGMEVVQVEDVTYVSVEAPPSIIPMKKYCDVTGLEAPYVDPKSTLRYHNAEIYDVIKSFQPAVIQSYLAVRGNGVVLR